MTEKILQLMVEDIQAYYEKMNYLPINYKGRELEFEEDIVNHYERAEDNEGVTKNSLEIRKLMAEQHAEEFAKEGESFFENRKDIKVSGKGLDEVGKFLLDYGVVTLEKVLSWGDWLLFKVEDNYYLLIPEEEHGDE